jgi:hypothetical protein
MMPPIAPGPTTAIRAMRGCFRSVTAEVDEKVAVESPSDRDGIDPSKVEFS